jgi:ABC-type uncharacterized transport system substrate-binding protein
VRNSMRRREFILILGGAATLASLGLHPAWAQQDGRIRRIGMVVPGAQDSRASQLAFAALREGLARLGWIEGRNLRIDPRYAAEDPERIRSAAVELASLAPDVMITTASTTPAVQEQTKTIPIVIVQGGDPVASGLVRNVARPEGNITGFISMEPSIVGKWLELLKEAAPHVTRVAIIFHPEMGPAVPNYLSLIDTAAPILGVAAIKTPVRSAVEMVRAIDAFAAEPNGGLLILPPSTSPARDTIIQLAVQHRLPAIYPTQGDAAAGGLLAYATDFIDQYRRAAAYVDRLLRGARVSDLPVQFPTKFELVVNIKTAKAIGLTIPEAFLLRADELIE